MKSLQQAIRYALLQHIPVVVQIIRMQSCVHHKKHRTMERVKSTGKDDIHCRLYWVKGDFNAIGTNSAAGLMESWESREHKMGFKMCKHSIAAMFIDKLKVKEPNSYPTVDARIAFEEKLVKEIEEVAAEFGASYKRGGITTIEIIFALAQGLNLDEVETAYVILNSNF
jgi:hypothetical protein